MSHFKLSAERARAVSLIEVMVSQVIVMVLIAGLVSLVAVLVKKMNAEANTSDAQVRLRQATHLLLRDTQGLGGDASDAGDLITVVDASTDATVADLGTDIITLFKRDESVCGGALAATQNGSSINLTVEQVTISPNPPACPISAGVGPCSADELMSHSFVLKRGVRSVRVRPQTVAGCVINLLADPDADERYNSIVKDGCEGPGPDGSPTTGSCADLSEVIDDIQNGTAPFEVLIGNTFTYSVLNSRLRRGLNDGAAEDVLDNVLDLQVERIFDENGDGIVQNPNLAGVNETVTVSTGLEPLEIRPEAFLGIRLGVVTFGRAAGDGLEVRPPTLFSNHSLAAAPTGRRYRSSFIFSAARNRAGT